MNPTVLFSEEQFRFLRHDFKVWNAGDHIIKLFIGLYPALPKNIVIFMGAGFCFSENGGDALNDMRFPNHITYEPIFHHHFSPNDNKLQGVAKKLWREHMKSEWDDVQRSIALMTYLDKAK